MLGQPIGGLTIDRLTPHPLSLDSAPDRINRIGILRLSDMLEMVGWFTLIVCSTLIVLALIDVPYQIWKNKKDLKKAIQNQKIARINFCSIDKDGEKCAEYIEKEINAEIRGTLANKKEKPTGNCTICSKKAKEVVYIGKSY